MLKYLISYNGDGTVTLENITSNERSKKVLQLTEEEFEAFMTYRTVSRADMLERLWNISDKSLGKIAISKTVDIAYSILGREQYA